MKCPSLNRSVVVDRPSSRDSRSRTILIVDDSDTVRGSVRAVLESQTGWQVCGEATDSVDAIEKARKGGTMKLQRVVFVLIGMMFLFAVTASAQQVKTDYDRGANFAQYKTYSWEHVKTKDPLDVDRIKNAVNAALAAKGWTRVDSGGDVSIVAMEITQNQQTLNTFYDGFGGGWGPTTPTRTSRTSIRAWIKCSSNFLQALRRSSGVAHDSPAWVPRSVWRSLR